ncbi:MAG: response regulator [Candidatus Omnitrophica bacterium]|nr:response regulator [Candidatus Omnitrophota bacterium]
MAKKILVIDDEPDVLKIIMLRLERAGYEVVGGMDGREAMDLARHLLPDLIILDVYLPDMNGDDVARVIKNNDKLKHIPIILVSATTVSVAERAKDCGAEGCLGKPFEPEELLGLVKRVLGQKGGVK